MVLEQLYPVDFLKENPKYAFILSLALTVFGVFFAMVVFPNDPALVIVAMASTLLIPSLYQFTVFEEELHGKVAEAIDYKDYIMEWINSNKKLFMVYMYMFFGAFFVFAFFSMFLPRLAANQLFRQQLAVLTGGASFQLSLFWSLLTHNFQVLMLCFIVSLIAGNGSIYLIIWNASVWGTIFGNLAKTTAMNLSGSTAILFLLIMLSVFPHVFLEMASYVIAVMSGTVLSNAIAREKLASARFGKILVLNMIVLATALLVLVIAVAVETYVLNNFTTYQTIIQLSFGV
ncbi:stage II sporulation protein M [Candidatus Woesearchaeota archaeon]|nr:stage II sporulation protein M [Candidatus Woesearchaeota archaeon]